VDLADVVTKSSLAGAFSWALKRLALTPGANIKTPGKG
jgi:hypothetical protein